MRLSQSDLASYLGVAQATVSQATSRGHKCRGYPVRAWAVYDGAGRVAGYDVPTHIMQRSSETDGSDVDSSAFVAAASILDSSSGTADSPATDQVRPNPSSPSWAEAATAAAGSLPAVSANASASHAVASMADAVQEHPQLMVDVTDALVLLGSGGLMLAATEDGGDYRAAKVLGGAGAAFALWRYIRHWQARHQTQKDQTRRSSQQEIARQQPVKIPSTEPSHSTQPAAVIAAV